MQLWSEQENTRTYMTWLTRDQASLLEECTETCAAARVISRSPRKLWYQIKGRCRVPLGRNDPSTVLTVITVENYSLVLMAHLWQKHFCLMLDFSLHNKHVHPDHTLPPLQRRFSRWAADPLAWVYIFVCLFHVDSCCCLHPASLCSTSRATDLPSWSCISRFSELFFTLFWGLKESFPFSGNWKINTD